MFDDRSQPLQDDLSQRWVMLCGRRIEPSNVGWLMGPYGYPDVIADTYIQRLAADEALTIDRTTRGAGLMPSFDALELPPADRARLRPEIARFYEATADHDLHFWSQWSLLFRPFAGLVQRLYSRRLQQLNLPLSPLDASRGVSSAIVRLYDRDGALRYTVWYRTLKATQRVIYSGIYMTCQPPIGPRCVKVVFPLPRGNATVILRPDVGADGDLELASSGRGFGDAGFYFLLVDRRGRHWAQYIKSFRERIRLFMDEEDVLRTDHEFRLWGLRALSLHYRLDAQRPASAPSDPPPV